MVKALINSPLKAIKFVLYRFRYLLNYVLIGFLSIIIEMLLIRAITPFNLQLIWVRTGGFLVGMLFSFILNSKLNFKVPKSKNMRTFGMFLIISTLAFVLNLVIMRFLGDLLPLGYNSLRFITAAMVFMASYTAHRKITFNFVKNVGVAVYLNSSDSISEAYSKIRDYADFIHIDLVDKTIDPNAKAIDLTLMNKINHTWMLKKILHIMSKKPSIWINRLYKNVDVILVHTEIDEPVREVIALCKKFNKKVGLVIGPDTDMATIKPYLPLLDFVQVMGISSLGKSGQLFNPHSLEKLKELNHLRNKYHFEIFFDGGVKPTNIGRINAKYIVSSSGLLTSKDPIRSLMELVRAIITLFLNS